MLRTVKKGLQLVPTFCIIKKNCEYEIIEYYLGAGSCAIDFLTESVFR